MTDVMLVAPVRAYREALSELINKDDRLRVAAHAASAAEALATLASNVPEVTILDFTVDHFLSVLSALRRMAPATHVVAIAIPVGSGTSESVVRAAEIGVTGFVDVDQPLADVVDAVHLSVIGECPCSPRIAATLLTAMRRRPTPWASYGIAGTSARQAVGSPTTTHPALTARELLVAQLVAHGMTNQEIARELVVGVSTVKTHVHSVLRKLGVDRREKIQFSNILGPGLAGFTDA